jgi:3-deoxy-D-manno-octulosonic acid (KDO) 8-phosphate synthase
MQQYATTVLDVTHSLQQPNQTVGVTGGRPDMIETVRKTHKDNPTTILTVGDIC